MRPCQIQRRNVSRDASNNAKITRDYRLRGGNPRNALAKRNHFKIFKFHGKGRGTQWHLPRVISRVIFAFNGLVIRSCGRLLPDSLRLGRNPK